MKKLPMAKGKHRVIQDPDYGYRRLDPIPHNKEIADFYQSQYYDLIRKGGRAPEIRRLYDDNAEARAAGLQAHIHRVRDIVAELAPNHGVDPEQGRLGALAHDVARAMSDQQLLEQAACLGLPVGVIEKHAPVMLHGPVGAEILRREDGLDDEPLYQAVYWHTSAHPSLDSLGKIVFLADKLDPQKIAYYPYLPRLKELAFQSLDQGILEFATQEIIARTQRGEALHPVVVETRNALLAGLAPVAESPL